MKKFIVLFYIILCTSLLARAQFGFDKMVELTGVVMTADSLMYLPYVNIYIPTKQIGTRTSEKGVFSIIAEKGDTLEFTYMGFRKKRYIVPENLEGHRFSVIQLLTQDTFYLANTIIRPQLSKEEFEKAFKTWDIPDDKYETARKNTEFQTMRFLLATMPRDGRESQQLYQQQIAQRNYWAGQQPPMTIFSPLAWLDFIKAWKRGDFKRKR